IGRREFCRTPPCWLTPPEQIKEPLKFAPHWWGIPASRRVASCTDGPRNGIRCLLGRCSIAPRWEADAIPVSPLGASSLLALRLIVTSRVLHRGQANPACPVLDKSASILLGQHDRDHALGDRRISWIGGVIR